MDKKKKIIISVVIVLLIIATIAGVTSAYFRFATNSGTAQTTAGKLDIDYNISDPTLEGLLIPAATRSSSIMESVTAKLNTGSVPGDLNIYITPTFITGMPASALMWEVDVIDTSSNVLAQYSGDFTDAVINTPIKVVDAYPLTSSLVTFNIYIWLNGARIDNDNFSSDNGFSATITADSEQITGEFDLIPNPITDYIYILGSDQTTISQLTSEFFYEAQDEDTGRLYPEKVSATEMSLYDPITIANNEILLVRYIGSNTTVNVPSTYTIDGVTYKCKVISSIQDSWRTGTFLGNQRIKRVNFDKNLDIIGYGYDNDLDTYTYVSGLMQYAFWGCTSLTTVSSLPLNIIDMGYTFADCTSLMTAPDIPDSITSMYYTFYNCSSLLAAPDIPDSVTDMSHTFDSCTSLMTAPEIPDSVVNMATTFGNCSSLVTVPDIPDSVTDMSFTFVNCTSMVSGPTIGNSVTDISGAFWGCTNLTGTIRINSANARVIGYSYTFGNTTKPITVEVPANSTTLNNINPNRPANVTVTTFTPQG